MRGSRPLSGEEVTRVRDAFSGKLARRNMALFLLGANTGFRVSELLSLRLGDVMEEDGTIKDRLTVSRRNMKGKKSSRNVALNPHGQKGMVPWLLELGEREVVHKDDFLFFSGRDTGRAIGRSQAWRVLTRTYKACGLKGKLGTHAMRKTFANNIYNHLLSRVAAGEAIDAFRATSKALGHADIKSTDQYLSFLVADIDESINCVGVG